MNRAFIICRRKRRGNASWVLEQELREQGIEAYRVTPHRVPLKPRSWASVFINYGCSQVPVWWDTVPMIRAMFNTFNTVRTSSRKTLMQQALREADVPCLYSTRDITVAEAWADDGATVVCRTLNASHSGRGIVLAHSIGEIVDAQIYTKLFTGHMVREYRVYVVDGIAVDIVEKRRRGRGWCRDHGIDREDEYSNVIRSWRNGWVFARNTFEADGSERRDICVVAEQAARAIDLRLGAVDIIVNRTESGELNDVRVVETNTSLGIDLGATSSRLLAQALANSIRSV